MTGPLRDHSGVFDLFAQLRRRWAVVTAACLIGLVVGVAALQTLPRDPDSGTVPFVAALGIVLIFVLLGLVTGFLIGLVLVHLHPRVTTVEDVRRVTGLPVVAQLPASTIDSDDRDDSALDARGSSRRMRTSLREGILNTRTLAGGTMPDRILVARTDTVTETSGVDGGLARALVESGYSPALVHTDFEGRMLARPATLDETPLGEASRPDAGGYQRIPVTDRVASARPSERLGQVVGFLHSLSERYDVTVSQASSNSLPVPLRSIAPAATAVLLVVRSNRTTVESLMSLSAELSSLDVAPIGVVMTGVAPRHRVLLRGTWMPSDFRDTGVVASASSGVSAPLPAPLRAPLPARGGFSIADLATVGRSPSTFTEAASPADHPKDQL